MSSFTLRSVPGNLAQLQTSSFEWKLSEEGAKGSPTYRNLTVSCVDGATGAVVTRVLASIATGSNATAGTLISGLQDTQTFNALCTATLHYSYAGSASITSYYVDSVETSEITWGLSARGLAGTPAYSNVTAVCTALGGAVVRTAANQSVPTGANSVTGLVVGNLPLTEENSVTCTVMVYLLNANATPFSITRTATYWAPERNITAVDPFSVATTSSVSLQTNRVNTTTDLTLSGLLPHLSDSDLNVTLTSTSGASVRIANFTRLDVGTIRVDIATVGAAPGTYDLAVGSAVQPQARAPMKVTGLAPLAVAYVHDRLVSTVVNTTTFVRLSGVEAADALRNATIQLGPCQIRDVHLAPGTNDTVVFTILSGAPVGVYQLKVFSPVQGSAYLTGAIEVVLNAPATVLSIEDPVISNRVNTTTDVTLSGLLPHLSDSDLNVTLTSTSGASVRIANFTRLDVGTIRVDIATVGAAPGTYDLAVGSAVQPQARAPMKVTGLAPLAVAYVHDRLVSTVVNTTTFVRLSGVEAADALRNATIQLGPCQIRDVHLAPGTNDTVVFTILSGAPVGVYQLKVFSPVQGSAYLTGAIEVVLNAPATVLSIEDPVISNRVNTTTDVTLSGLLPHLSDSDLSVTLTSTSGASVRIANFTRLDVGTIRVDIATVGAAPGTYDLAVGSAVQPQARAPMKVTGLAPLAVAYVHDPVVSTVVNTTTFVRLSGVEAADALRNAAIRLGPCQIRDVHLAPGTNDTVVFTILAGAPAGVYQLKVFSPVQGSAYLSRAIEIVPNAPATVLGIEDPVISNRVNTTTEVTLAGLLPVLAGRDLTVTLTSASGASVRVVNVTRLDNGTIRIDIAAAGATPGTYDLTVASALQPKARLPASLNVTDLGPLAIAYVEDPVVSTVVNTTTFVRLSGVEAADALRNAAIRLGPCQIRDVHLAPGTNDTVVFTILAGAPAGVYQLKVFSPVQGSAYLSRAIEIVPNAPATVLGIEDPVISNRVNTTTEVTLAGLLPALAGRDLTVTLTSASGASIRVVNVTRLDNGTIRIDIAAAGATPGTYDLTVASALQPKARLPASLNVTDLGPLAIAYVEDPVVSTVVNTTTFVRLSGVEAADALRNAAIRLGPCQIRDVHLAPGTNDTVVFTILAGAPAGVYQLKVFSPVQGSAYLSRAIEIVPNARHAGGPAPALAGRDLTVTLTSASGASIRVVNVTRLDNGTIRIDIAAAGATPGTYDLTVASALQPKARLPASLNVTDLGPLAIAYVEDPVVSTVVNTTTFVRLSGVEAADALRNAAIRLGPCQIRDVHLAPGTNDTVVFTILAGAPAGVYQLKVFSPVQGSAYLSRAIEIVPNAPATVLGIEDPVISNRVNTTTEVTLAGLLPALAGRDLTVTLTSASGASIRVVNVTRLDNGTIRIDIAAAGATPGTYDLTVASALQPKARLPASLNVTDLGPLAIAYVEDPVVSTVVNTTTFVRLSGVEAADALRNAAIRLGPCQIRDVHLAPGTNDTVVFSPVQGSAYLSRAIEIVPNAPATVLGIEDPVISNRVNSTTEVTLAGLLPVLAGRDLTVTLTSASGASVRVVNVTRLDNGTIRIDIAAAGATPGTYDLTVASALQPKARLPASLNVTDLGPLAIAYVEDPVVSTVVNTTTFVRLSGVEAADALRNAANRLGPCQIRDVHLAPGTNDTVVFTILAGAPAGVYQLKVFSPVQGSAYLSRAIEIVPNAPATVLGIEDPVISNRVNTTTEVTLAGLLPALAGRDLTVTLTSASGASVRVVNVTRLDNGTIRIDIAAAGATPGTYDLTVASALQPKARLPASLNVTDLGPLAIAYVEDPVVSTVVNTTTFVRLSGVEAANALRNAAIRLGPCQIRDVHLAPGTNDTVVFTILAGAPAGVYQLKVFSPVQGSAYLSRAIEIVPNAPATVLGIEDPVISNRVNTTTEVTLAGLLPVLAGRDLTVTLTSASGASVRVVNVTRLDNGTIRIDIAAAGAAPGTYDLTVASALQPKARLPASLNVTDLGPLAIAYVEDPVVSTVVNTTTFVRLSGVEAADALRNAAIRLGPCQIRDVHLAPGTNDTVVFTILAGAPAGVYQLKVFSPVQGGAYLSRAIEIVPNAPATVLGIEDPVISNRVNTTTEVTLAGLLPVLAGRDLTVTLTSASGASVRVVNVTRLDNGTIRIDIAAAGAAPGTYDLTVASALGLQPKARLPASLNVTDLGPLVIAYVEDPVVSTVVNTTTFVRLSGVEAADALRNAAIRLGPCQIRDVHLAPGTNDTVVFTILAGAPAGVYQLKVCINIRTKESLGSA
eukprot:tig00020557_g11113.t1